MRPTAFSLLQLRNLAVLAGVGLAFGLAAGVRPAYADAAQPNASTPDNGANNGDNSGEDTHYDPYPVVVLRTLDKITARAHTIEEPVDQEFKFGTLRITVKACYKRPPEETPETAAFLIIYDAKPDEPPQKVFSGWMFASSPALSALEHPVYDLWVLNCLKSMPKHPDQAKQASQDQTQN